MRLYRLDLEGADLRCPQRIIFWPSGYSCSPGSWPPWWASMGASEMTVPHKQGACKKHGDATFFWSPDKRKKSGGYWACIECSREQNRRYRAAHPHAGLDRLHKIGKARPMNEAKDCSSYLGIVVAERVLSKFFENITRMPNGNPGYDFICGKGFKIEVKSSCLVRDACRTSPRWQFRVRGNQVADYFLCLAFDNRDNLEPMHVWLIPGDKISYLKSCLSISSREKYMAKWSRYEQPLDKVLVCCDALREKGVV